ncbi:Ig-like domain-containing protein [Methanobrevibacter sp.]|uniref:Ig-like domain-containing protein n=1 Tax=Methanobrevibacter sp. TaxID=66852 RepID=UPI0038647D51
MKLNKIILVSILLLAILSLGAVNAQDNATSDMGEGENSGDLTPCLEVSNDMSCDDIQTDTDDKLTVFAEDDVGDMTADNVTVDVSNVFEGQNASISVTVPEATGTVNITVGEKLYTPEFIGGVATQSISEYSIGLINVTVKYNDIVKETSFKVLDGVITNETFDDYFEISGRYYYLRSFIPEGITLDFRGVIERNYRITGENRYISIAKPYNITSTTGDGVIDVYLFEIVSGAIGSNVSNIKVNGLNINAPKCSIVNFTALNWLVLDSSNFKIADSNINRFTMRADLNVRKMDNILIINCTVNDPCGTTIPYMDNVSVINSTFNNGLSFSCHYSSQRSVTNITVINCSLNGLSLDAVEDALVENCSLSDNMYFRYVKDVIVKNNFVNASSSTYAILLGGSGDIYNTFVDNILYSKYYCGNSAIAYHPHYDIYFWPETHNVFGNNTPIQTDLNIGITADTIFYDENTTVLVNMPGIEGNVVFYFNDEKMSTVKLVDGIATQTIGKYELGINNISVVYEDIANDIWGINYTSFKVNKVNYCPVSLVYDSIVEDKFSIVNVVLPDDANGTVTFTLSNETHCITIKQDANGTNNLFNVFALPEGTYNMSAIFESVKYVTNSTTDNIIINHISVYNLTAGNIVMDYKDGSKYNVLVTKDGKAVVGETVKITFNGKTNNVKTDKNGYATLTLDAAPKTYTIKAVYNGVTKSTAVTIKNILKASNISKKKAKKIKFSATLKNSKGKAIAGKKITFKFKGKTYSAKTNKKGIAAITLKNLKVGKYSITSKYGACTVKNTIKIKK